MIILKKVGDFLYKPILLKLTLAFIVFFLLFHFNRINLSALSLMQAKWQYCLLAFTLTLPPFWIVSYRLKLILLSQNIDITLKQSLYWTMVGSFFDLTMPSSNGGDVVKAGYLVNYLGKGYKTNAIMAVAFDRVIGLLGLFLLASIVSVLGWQFLEKLPARSLLVGFSLFASLGALIFFRIVGSHWLYNKLHLSERLSTNSFGIRFKNIIGSFNLLRKRTKLFYLSLGLSVLNHLFWCGSLFLIAAAIGNPIEIFQGLIVFPLAIFGGVFGVAGGFGVGTAAFDFLFSHLLLVQNGALIGLIFQIFGALSRLFGMPFYLLLNEDLSFINFFDKKD